MPDSEDATGGADDDSLRRWQEAEQRLSTEPRTPEEDPDPGERAEVAAIPEEPEFGLEDIEVDSGTSRYFWSAVVLANAAVAGVSIGLMLVGFRGEWTVGGLLVLVGLLAGLRTHHVYRQFRDYRAERDAVDADADATGTDADIADTDADGTGGDTRSADETTADIDADSP